MSAKPFHDRDGFIWMDGEMLPWRDANVHFLTHGLHYGTGVFEGERAYDGHIFKSRLHSERLINSANIIYMDMEYSADELEAIKREVMEANNLTNAYIRMAAWRGSEQMGIDVSGTKTHIAVAAWEWGSYFPAELREKGISLATSKWHRPHPDSAPVHSKCAGLYVLGTMAKREAQDKGFNDCLMYDHEGYIAESSGANFFAVQDGTLITPKADRFLNGLTRQTVIELTKELGIPVEERRIKPEELNNFQEIFLTGTAAEMTPVGKIDDHSFTPADITKKLYAAYEERVRTPKS